MECRSADELFPDDRGVVVSNRRALVEGTRHEVVMAGPRTPDEPVRECRPPSIERSAVQSARSTESVCAASMLSAE